MLLSNLHIFPSLELLSIEFLGCIYQRIMDPTTAEELELQVRDAEEREGWRALTAGIYKALAENEEIYAKGLELKNVLFKRASTFASLRFHTFLSRLETFGLSLVSLEARRFGDLYEPNRSREYIAFGSKLDIKFFDHLSNVTSLTIKAPERGPMGEKYRRGVPLVLRKDHMPHLQYVHLEYIIVFTELLDFLVGHTATLEHICLRDCFADDKHGAGDDSYWAKFFDPLRDAGFRKLRRLEILPVDPPFTLTRYNSWWRDEPILKALDPGRRLFAYMHEWGHVIPDQKPFKLH